MSCYSGISSYNLMSAAMSYSLYKYLNSNKYSSNTYAADDSKGAGSNTVFALCMAGVLAGLVGIVYFQVQHEQEARQDIEDKISASSTVLVSSSCTVNQRHDIRFGRTVKRILNTYRTKDGLVIAKPVSAELEMYSWMNAAEARKRLTVWSVKTGCPIGPSIE